MNQIVGRDPKKFIKFVKQEEIYGPSYEDIPRRVPDITKLRTVLKTAPKTTLEQGMRATIEWFRHESSSKPALTSAAMQPKKKK